jgi:nucleolin
MPKDKIINKKKPVESDQEDSDSDAAPVVNAGKKQKVTNDTGKKVVKADPKKKVQADSDDSSAEDIIVPKNKGKAVQKGDQKQVQKKKAGDDTSDTSSEDGKKPATKQAGKPVAAQGKKPVQAQPKKAVQPDSDDSEPTPPKKNVPAKAQPKKAVDPSSSEEDTPVVKGKPAPTKVAPKGKAQADSSDDEDDTPPKNKTTTSSKPAAKVQPKTLPKKTVDSDESDEEEVVKAPVKGKPVAAKKPASDDEEEEEEETPKAAPQKDSGSHEAFVKGLPYSASDNDVKEFFAGCGAIDSVNLLMGFDGRSKGIAFVRFFDDKSVQAAVQLNGEDFGGRSISVEKSTPKESRAPRDNAGGYGAQGGYGAKTEAPRTERDPNSSTVFVGNLSFNTEAESVQSFFEACGKVKAVRIAYNQEGQSRGFAHVEFMSPDSVDKAMSKVGQNIDGRPIRVDFSGNKKTDGGGDRGGRGGFGGGGRGGYGGGRGGGFGGGRGGYGQDETSAARKGSIGSFQGNRVKF